MLNFCAMRLPPADLSYLQERFLELASQIQDLWDTPDTELNEVDSPGLLRDAMAQLIDLLGRINDEESGSHKNPAELTTLGEYGLHLLDELAQLAARVEQPQLGREIELLGLPFALWIARNGGEIRQLSTAVNALAHFANQSAQPNLMADLYNCCCELIEATSPSCEDKTSLDPADPWRLLLLNRAIVATRSHNPELMEPAYDAIVESLPDVAAVFFAEGMEQMTTINYPDHVQEVVRRYYTAHARPKRLH